MTERSLSFAIGFCRNVFAPALIARSLLPTRSRPDKTITGIEDSFSLAFILSRTLKPSPAGRPRSSITKSGRCFRASAILATPSAALITS
jgi:hypothetical protein